MENLPSNMNLSRGPAYVEYAGPMPPSANSAPTCGAIERLTSTCGRLSNLKQLATHAADAINGHPVNQYNTGSTLQPIKDAPPVLTIAELCSELAGLVGSIEDQVQRICIGIGC